LKTKGKPQLFGKDEGLADAMPNLASLDFGEDSASIDVGRADAAKWVWSVLEGTAVYGADDRKIGTVQRVR
jgi:hypothetical protein